MAAEKQCTCAEVNEDELYPKLDEIVSRHGASGKTYHVLHEAQNLFGYLPRKCRR